MNQRRPDRSDEPIPPSDTAERHDGERNWRMSRRAWLAMLSVTGLAGAGFAYGSWFSDDIVNGVVIHPRPRELGTLRFADDKGTATSLSAFRGRVVLLNVWATWCLPCRDEMPTLDRLQAALGGPSFEVVAVSLDAGGLPAVQAFFREIGVKHLRPYLDTFHDVAALASTGIPLTLLIDRSGREVGRKLGPATWDDPQMLRLIRRYLPATP
ncbi:TlpA family protein disulfide reductase [Burkholderia vietnamiensis]|uniref:TlpA family protein disulfide reductase n=1 Tax=Burkholderia vietnamiensis TaxID=60552 RepID=UPI001CF4466B|nr:TlpA disulfide reductase family protein [Burkholderia vietnamiensis]MCA8289428.1 TlpA family protein disulfide reductase [Burkholderia vietnamiensis]